MRILRALRIGDGPLLERAAFATALGLGSIAYGVLALGVAQLLRPLPMGVLLAGFAAPGAAPAVALAREAAASLARGARKRSALAVATGGTLAALLLLALVAALAPPAGNDWDGLSYHLADPALYLRRGGIYYLFWESHSNFPFTVEMLYTVALLCKSAAAAHAIHGLYLGIICLALAAAWGRFWPEAPSGWRWLAPLLFAGAPIVVWSATVAYNDLALAAYEVLALYGVALWARTGRSGWLWAGALALGFALGTKMTAMVEAALLAPIIAAVALRPPHTSPTVGETEDGTTPPSVGAAITYALRRLLVWGATAVAVASPWYIKSFIFTRNPVYPFFFNLFPNTRYWNAEIAASYAHHQAEFGAGHGWQHLLAVPWDLLLNQARFTDGGEAFRVLFGGLGPAFLALAPAVLILRRRDRLALGALLFAAAYGVIWFHLTPQTRYLLPVMPLVALAGARGLSGLVEERRMARFAGYGVLLAHVGHAFLAAALLAGPAWPVVSGQQAPEEYLRRHLDVYPVCEYVNEYLPRDARLMLIHEVRGFYLERDYLWGNEGHHAAIPWSRFRDEAEMRAYLRTELGVTHVLVNHRIEGRDARPGGWERRLWEAIHAGTLEPVYDDPRGFRVYEVKPAAAPE